MTELKLDIGAGGFSSDESFKSVDAFTEADINALMWDLPQEENTVDVIFSSNALEHISKFQVVPTLREWNRVLKPGGKLQLIVPDLEWSCLWWLAHQDVDWSMDIIYGHQAHEGEYHKTGFSKKIIMDYLMVSGNWDIHKVEFMGGELEQEHQEGKTISHVNQRLINVEASKCLNS